MQDDYINYLIDFDEDSKVLNLKNLDTDTLLLALPLNQSGEVDNIFLKNNSSYLRIWVKRGRLKIRIFIKRASVKYRYYRKRCPNYDDEGFWKNELCYFSSYSNYILYPINKDFMCFCNTHFFGNEDYLRSVGLIDAPSPITENEIKVSLTNIDLKLEDVKAVIDDKIDKKISSLNAKLSDDDIGLIIAAVNDCLLYK